MANRIDLSLAPMVGYLRDLVRKARDSGREISQFREIRVKEKLEEQRKRVQPVYSAKGKIIEHDSSGRYLDVSI